MKESQAACLRRTVKSSFSFFFALILTVPNLLGQTSDVIDSKPIALRIEFNINYEDRKSNSELTVLIPQDYLERQKILSEYYTIKPTAIYVEAGRRYAYFDLAQLGYPESISVDFEIELTRQDLSTLKTKQPTESSETKTDLSTYLAEERYLETADVELIEVAKSLVGENDTKTVLNVQDYVASTLSYTGYSLQDKGASTAFLERGGDCTEFADLFVTLCRINGIPARGVDGYVIENLLIGHSWVEVHLSDVGWVPFDPVWYAQDNETTYESLRNMYVYISSERNDNNLGGYHYYAYTYYGKPISVEQTLSYRLRQ